MDSESYLIKIIQSNTKHTQDSLYLQTTIGQSVRWPIVLLISTAAGALVLFLCLIWTMVCSRSKSCFKTKKYDVDDTPPIIVTSSPSSPKNFPLDFEAHFFKDLIWPSQIQASNSEVNLRVDEKSPLLGPKKMVSWANADTISFIPRANSTRRHSDLSPCHFESPSLKATPRRHSVDMSSEVSPSSTAPLKTRTSSPVPRKSSTCAGALIMKSDNHANLHQQISKTIEVLDDLNKSLRVSHQLSDCSGDIVVSRKNTEAANVDQILRMKRMLPSPVKDPTPEKKRKHKTKTTKPNCEIKSCLHDKHYKGISALNKHINPLDAKDTDELEKLLDAEFDTFQGQ